MKKVSLSQMIASIKEPFTPYHLFYVNNNSVRLVKINGMYHKHKHDDIDELFIVFQGTMGIKLEQETVVLQEGDAFVVPKGVYHQSFSEQGAVVLMVEPEGQELT